MAINQFNLLHYKRFLPLFITQFLGTFNDYLFINALAIIITSNLSDTLNLNPSVLMTIAAAIFILPFFLFSALAGQLADKYEKSQLIRYTKLGEIVLMLLFGAGFYLHSTTLLTLTLFLLGTQATFFGPMKYSILPDQMTQDELIAANGLLEAGTYLAILSGTLIGGLLATFHIGATLVASTAFLLAIAGYLASRQIPAAAPADSDLTIRFNLRNIRSETQNIIQYTLQNRNLSLAVLAIAWFWLVGGTYLSQVPNYVKQVLGAGTPIVTLFLSFFTMGIALGSLICNRVLKGKIHATFVPLACLGMTLFTIDLVLAGHHLVVKPDHLLTLYQFLSYLQNWHVLVDLLLLSACGGIYVVPLYAILQSESDPAFRSRVIASSNIMNALFMVTGAMISSVILACHLSASHVFILLAIANVFVAIYICNLLPEQLVKSFLIWLFKSLYRVEVRGMENYYNAGNRILIIANHTSFLDAALIAAFLPHRLTFAINTHYAQKTWVKILLKLFNTYPIDPTNPLAAKSLIEYLRDEDQRLVIFPEGRITVTGGIMKIYEGPGLIADKAKAKLLPIRIDGAQYSPFSYLKGKVKIRWFPKITLTILQPRKFDLPKLNSGRERREIMSEQLYDVMIDTMFLSSNVNETLYQSLLNARTIHGGKHLVLEDIERKPISLQRLILGSIVIGRRIARNTRQGENVGFLLPNSMGAVVTFFAMQAFHRVPAMLNYSSGVQHIVQACKTAEVKYIYSSRKFIELAELQHVADALVAHGYNVIYLEDIRAQMGVFEKMTGKLLSWFPQLYYRISNGIKKFNEHEFTAMPAEVLFTSGSEGTPKGVVLSHANIQANRFQMLARIDISPADRVFNALPMFHAFGLNTATLTPIMSGIRVFMYPSPLHYRIVPEICYDTNATITFGTDTFLSGYAKYAHPFNFYSIRYVFAGAEKIREETRRIWMQKFGVRIFEGYGATEASPVLATNTAMQYKSGTVGRLLPGIRFELRPVEGIKDGARLCISGPNVMMGYLYANAPGIIQPLPDGWHDTGDIVTVDEEGFVTIKGRAKRFAKIAGEMISLTAIEDEICQIWPEYQHAVISVPDPRKGEQIVLVTSCHEAQQNLVIEHFRKRGVAELGMPRRIIVLDKLPVLGSGKVDYVSVKKVIETPVEVDVEKDEVEGELV